jgi:cytochrome c oxidase cbb3-type subunit 3
MMRAVQLLIAIIVVAAVVASCKREERGFRVQPPSANTVYLSTTSGLHAGMGSTTAPSPVVVNDYEVNAHALSEGKRLYDAMNCSGCHFHGGGGIGPPLMDDKWVYGSEPDQIFATIIQGRPNGMPSFRNKIPDYQVWQIAAYVRSLSGLTSKQAAPGRDDHMQTKPAENSMPTSQPTNSRQPPSTVMPG